MKLIGTELLLGRSRSDAVISPICLLVLPCAGLPASCSSAIQNPILATDAHWLRWLGGECGCVQAAYVLFKTDLNYLYLLVCLFAMCGAACRLRKVFSEADLNDLTVESRSEKNLAPCTLNPEILNPEPCVFKEI